MNGIWIGKVKVTLVLSKHWAEGILLGEMNKARVEEFLAVKEVPEWVENIGNVEKICFRWDDNFVYLILDLKRGTEEPRHQEYLYKVQELAIHQSDNFEEDEQ